MYTTYTPEEDALIRAHPKGAPYAELSALTGRSVQALISRRMRLAVLDALGEAPSQNMRAPAPKHYFTSAEDALILRRELPLAEIARRIGVSPMSVCQRRSRLLVRIHRANVSVSGGLTDEALIADVSSRKKAQKWTAQEDELVLNPRGLTNTQVGMLCGARSREMVCLRRRYLKAKARRLG